MSGGSHAYAFCVIKDLCGQMHDQELDDLMTDIAELAHDLEWFDSSDICEESYLQTVRRFKDKWFNSSREDRLKQYVDDAISKLKNELYGLLGVEESEKVKELDDT
jgi:hypothetical protein